MTSLNDLSSEVSGILATKWTTRQGQQVPEAEQVQLGNDAVLLNATVLYADLIESTKMVDAYRPWFSALVYKCYLKVACRLLQANQGTVTAFDGDRIMAVFLGQAGPDQAVGAAFELTYALREVVNPSIHRKFPDSTELEVRHAIGVDRSDLFIARTGVRGSNDLVWVGRAANYAAKLSGLREGDPSQIWLTKEVYDSLSAALKPQTPAGSNPIWVERKWTPKGVTVYRSTAYRALPQ